MSCEKRYAPPIFSPRYTWQEFASTKRPDTCLRQHEFDVACLAGSDAHLNRSVPAEECFEVERGVRRQTAQDEAAGCVAIRVGSSIFRGRETSHASCANDDA